MIIAESADTILELQELWLRGPFMELDAEACEAKVLGLGLGLGPRLGLG